MTSMPQVLAAMAAATFPCALRLSMAESSSETDFLHCALGGLSRASHPLLTALPLLSLLESLQ